MTTAKLCSHSAVCKQINELQITEKQQILSLSEYRLSTRGHQERTVLLATLWKGFFQLLLASKQMYNVTLTYDEVPVRELFLRKGPRMLCYYSTNIRTQPLTFSSQHCMSTSSQVTKEEQREKNHSNGQALYVQRLNLNNISS